jgi:hypothetical protein
MVFSGNEPRPRHLEALHMAVHPNSVKLENGIAAIER